MNINTTRFYFILFLAILVIPWGLIAIYITSLANQRYVSSSTIVVKYFSNENVSSGFSSLFKGGNVNREEAMHLTDYILSRDMVEVLDAEFDFRSNYRMTGLDFIYEIPKNVTQEQLHKYFKRQVSVKFDGLSYALTIETQGFTPEIAWKLNQAILRESRRFVNDMSQEVANEQLAFVGVQVFDAKNRLESAQKDLLDYKNQNEVFTNPQTSQPLMSQTIDMLKGRLGLLQAEERELLSYLKPEAPQVLNLRVQIDLIEQQIKDEQSKFDKRMVELIALQSSFEFASQQHQYTLASMENSRLEALKKMKSLVVISDSSQPKEALYPRVGYVLRVSFVVLLLLYGLMVLIFVFLKKHDKSLVFKGNNMEAQG